jgi:zinc protease
VRTTQARLVLIDKPGSSQTALRLTGIGADRKTPLFEALEVMNAALGGLFTSRLNTVLREQKGYTYGVGSGFQYRRLPGPFAIATSVRTDATAAALDDILRQVRDMSAKPMPARELDKTRQSLMLSLPGQFETNKSISARLASIFVYDLGLDYFSGLAARYSGVTAGRVQSAAKEFLQPDRMIIVGVGDKEKIEPLLTRLKIGPVEYRDLDASVLK